MIGKSQSIWNESMATGIPIIDEDHRLFCTLTAAMHDVADGAPTNPHHASELCDMLLAYLIGHFYREEMAMTAAGQPFYEVCSHKARHDEFLEKAERKIAAVKLGSPSSLDWLANMGERWITGHIPFCDKKVFPHMPLRSFDLRPLHVLAIEALKVRH